MKRLIRLFPLAVALGLAAPALSAASRDPLRPNILLILSDDQGYGDFGCFGNPVLKTPELDRLKAQSVFLSRFYVSPLCAPTRAALLTGRHQFRSGVWDTWRSRDNLPADETTIAEYLRRAGYRTGIFGKWHLGENHPFRPQDQGFGTTLIWNNADRFRPTFSKNGTTTPPFDRFQSDVINDEVIAFMTEPDERPFFAYVPYFLPHSHYNKQIGDEHVKPFAANPAVAPRDHQVYAMVTKLDEDVGRLLRTLQERGLEENTLVIFLPDNGAAGQRYNYGLRGTKTTVYEGGIRVPCFVRWPGRLVPGEIGENLAAIDLLPTLLEATGTRSTEKPVDGVSFWPLVTRQKPTLPDRHLFEQQQPQRSGLEPQPFVNARVQDRHHKLVFRDGEGSAELFDLTTDPGEQTNLAGPHRDVVGRLKIAYAAWFRSVSTERGFRPAEAILGSPAQPTLSLVHSHFSETDGYTLRVEREGIYRIEVQDLQPGLFPAGGFIGLTDKKSVWKIAVPARADGAATTMRLAPGLTRLFPYHEGKRAQTNHNGAENLGFYAMLVTGPLATP